MNRIKMRWRMQSVHGGTLVLWSLLLRRITNMGDLTHWLVVIGLLLLIKVGRQVVFLCRQYIWSEWSLAVDNRCTLTDSWLLCRSVTWWVNGKRLEFQDLRFILNQWWSNSWTLLAVLRVKRHHTCHCLKQKVTVFLLKYAKKSVEPVLSDLVWSTTINGITIF